MNGTYHRIVDDADQALEPVSRVGSLSDLRYDVKTRSVNQMDTNRTEGQFL